jgi:hypothetical protein
MPSWVPDWRHKDHYRLFSGRHSSYHTGGASVASYLFRIEARILQVDGVILDSVDSLGQTYFEYGSSPSPEHNMFQPDNVSNAYGCEESIKDAIWRTMTGDRTLQGHPAPVDYAEILYLPLVGRFHKPMPSRGARAFSRFMKQNASLSISGRRLDAYFTSKSKHFSERTADAVERIWRFTRTHRLMVTAHGRIGMVPHEARKGDLVGVFLGSDVPVLLRPGKSSRDPVKLVGSCYIHGIMAGEAIQWVEEGMLKVECISIS